MFYLMGLSATAITGRSRDVLAEHEHILSAIRSGDASEAARAMTAHLNMTQDLIERSPSASS
jgi:DNA-binding GntR family transcriptional regulator